MQNNWIGFFLFLAFGFSLTEGNAQNRDSLIVVSGQVVDATTKLAIPFAHIKIDRKGCIADSLGYYALECRSNDSLKVSSLGYSSQKIPLLLHQANWPFLIIELQATSYQLGEVNVFSFSSYEEFKRQFVALDLPEPEYKINESILSELAPYSRKVPNEIPPMYRNFFSEKPDVLDAISKPTDYLFYHLSKKERSKRKVAQMIKGEKQQNQIQAKYNRELVAHITKLKGEELTNFLAFCNSRIKVKVSSSDYEISAQIQQLLREYAEGQTITRE